MDLDLLNRLACALADSPHFRWRAGMRYAQPHAGPSLHTSDTRRPFSLAAVPDLGDPGTVGHLLAILREGADDPKLTIEPMPRGPKAAPTWEVTDSDGCIRATHTTEGEAVAVAILSLDPPRHAVDPQPPEDDPRQVPLFPDRELIRALE